MAQEITQLFYNFCFPDAKEGFENFGFYYLSHQLNYIYSHTEFNTPKGIYRNIFKLKIKDTTVTAYKHNDGTWVNVQANHFPTSAYPLLLPKVGDESLRYLCISEATGELIGETVLARVGNDIIETRQDKLTGQDKIIRIFTMKQESDLYIKVPRYIPNYIPRSIDWSGAKSFLCSNKIEAVKGTNLKIDSSILLQ